MDHRQFVASLTPELRAELKTPLDHKGLLHLAGYGGAILLVGALIAID